MLAFELAFICNQIWIGLARFMIHRLSGVVIAHVITNNPVVFQDILLTLDACMKLAFDGCFTWFCLKLAQRLVNSSMMHDIRMPTLKNLGAELAFEFAFIYNQT